jgi:hypothetical protein
LNECFFCCIGWFFPRIWFHVTLVLLCSWRMQQRRLVAKPYTCCCCCGEGFFSFFCLPFDCCSIEALLQALWGKQTWKHLQ